MKAPEVEEQVEEQSGGGVQYINVDVELETTTRMYGGIPQSPELIRAWVEAKGGIPEESVEEKVEAMSEAELDEKVELASTAFRSESGRGPYFRDFMVKQMMKESASVLGFTTKTKGLKTILTIGLVVQPERIFVGKTSEDGFEEFQGRVRTMQGPRSILSRKAFFEPGLRIPFRITFLKGPKFSVKDLRAILDHAGKFVGFGSARSREAGKFKVVRFDREP